MDTTVLTIAQSAQQIYFSCTPVLTRQPQVVQPDENVTTQQIYFSCTLVKQHITEAQLDDACPFS